MPSAELPDPLDTDPDYRCGQAALADGDYHGAARALAAAAERHPRAPVHYRLALARLARRSPRALFTGQLADIERLVRRALCTNPAYAPAAALLAVLKEEARESLERADDPPYLPELHARAVHCSREELTELRAHCPAAAGSVTWYLLIGRKDHAS